MEMCIKGIRMRYGKFIISLSILGGSVDINEIRSEKREMKVLILELYLKIPVKYITSF